MLLYSQISVEARLIADAALEKALHTACVADKITLQVVGEFGHAGDFEKARRGLNETLLDKNPQTRGDQKKSCCCFPAKDRQRLTGRYHRTADGFLGKLLDF